MLDIINPLKLFKKIFQQPQTISTAELGSVSTGPSDADKELLRKIGLTTRGLTAYMAESTLVNFERSGLYKEIDRALLHWMVGSATELYADVACLTGNTKITLLDNRTLSIKDLLSEYQEGKENWVYSCDYKGRPKAAKILHVVKQSKKKSVLRIWLDNGKYVDASTNHRFVLRGGEIITADKLSVGNSLMPFHRMVKDGYELIWNVEKGNWDCTHKSMYESVHNVDLKELNKGKSIESGEMSAIHHKDFDKLNNAPSNLQLMKSHEHIRSHCRSNSDPRFIALRRAGQKKYYQENKRKVSKQRSKAIQARWNDPKWKEEQVSKLRKRASTSEYSQQTTASNLLAWSGRKGKARKQKMSKFFKEHTRTEEHQKNLTAALIGRTLSEKHKESISKGLLKAVTEGRKKKHLDVVNICKFCGSSFVAPRSYLNKLFCSKMCLALSRRPKVEKRKCAYCRVVFLTVEKGSRRFCSNVCANRLRKIPVEIRMCKCGCGETFTCKTSSKQKFIVHHHTNVPYTFPSNNHKIVKIEKIGERVVYDLSVSGDKLFGLDAGIYIHNTTFNSLHNATVWVTSENKKYENELNKMLDRIGIEEKIFDWSWTTAAYGDLMVELHGEPGVGIVSVDDSQHPINISRVDNKGILVGFFETPLGQTSESRDLLPPWKYVHFRVLGVKRKRPIYSDPAQMEFRAVHLMSPDTRRVTSNYGTSLLINALPVYKRLRLAEDSLLLARLTRGILKYIYKVKVDSDNIEGVSELLDEIATTLKKARALSSDPNSPSYDSKSNPLASVEDIILPVWGDTNDVKIEKVGGEVDIRWIVDIEELRNQLAAALRTPLSLLGAWIDEASGALGSSAIEKLDIRFARSARRLQRSQKEGIKRICQIHLAYMNMDPDSTLFDVNMSETSTAEEEELKNALDTGTDIVTKFLDMLDSTGLKINKVGVIDFLNKKILKLGDFDLSQFIIGDKMTAEAIKEVAEKAKPAERIYNLDLKASTVLNEKEWRANYGKCKITTQVGNV